jgi:hypothetical protein
LDASNVFSLNVNQTLMAVVAIGSTITLILRHRNNGQTEAIVKQESDVEDGGSGKIELNK